MAGIAFDKDMNDSALGPKFAEKGADDTESMVSTAANTPMSNPTSSPLLSPAMASLSRATSIQEEPLSLIETSCKQHPEGTHRYYDRNGAIRYRYAAGGYEMDNPNSLKISMQPNPAPMDLHTGTYPGPAGHGGAIRQPCRHYGRDGRVVCR